MSYTTGLPSLDVILGRLEGLVEVYGPESSGKTTLAYHVLRKGGLYIGTESGYDPTLAPGLIDEENLLVLRPGFGEAAFEAAHEFLPGRVVIDSASALTPASFRGRKLHEEDQVGDQSRMLAFGARMLAKSCREKGGLVLFTQQLRQNIGKRFSGTTRIPYGRGIADFSDTRIELRRGAPLRRGHKEVGLTITAKTTKNRNRLPGAEVSLDLLYGEGFRRAASLLDWAIGRGVIQRSGSWYNFDGRVIGQGRDAACTAIEKEPLWTSILLQAKAGGGGTQR